MFHLEPLASCRTTVREFFCCKTVQVCVMQREYRMAETSSVHNVAQAGENEHKNPFLEL
jgi:hypothetical protein